MLNLIKSACICGIIGTAINYDLGIVTGCKEALTHINSTFESCKRNCDGQVYEGGKVSALFGGAELDLRNAVIEHEIYIQATSVFGGVKIWFPPNVRVVAEDASFLGGVKVYTKENPAVNAPVVHIRCSAIFGGVELY